MVFFVKNGVKVGSGPRSIRFRHTGKHRQLKTRDKALQPTPKSGAVEAVD